MPFCPLWWIYNNLWIFLVSKQFTYFFNSCIMKLLLIIANPLEGDLLIICANKISLFSFQPAWPRCQMKFFTVLFACVKLWESMAQTNFLWQLIWMVEGVFSNITKSGTQGPTEGSWQGGFLADKKISFEKNLIIQDSF